MLGSLRKGQEVVVLENNERREVAYLDQGGNNESRNKRCDPEYILKVEDLLSLQYLLMWGCLRKTDTKDGSIGFGWRCLAGSVSTACNS